MVICGQCGERNADGAQFCGACEAFLEWEGEPVTPVPTPVPHQGAGPITEPAPVRPSEVVQQPHYRPPTTVDDRPLMPGDLVCGRCGVGNPPSRRFCRRCAASLIEAEVVRQSWWRRLLARFRRAPRRTGERPENRRRRGAAGTVLSGIGRGIRWALGLLLVVGMLAYLFVPSFRNWVNPTANSLWHKGKSVFSPEYVPVRPTGITANGERPEHPAALASDNVNSTYWSVPEGGPEPTLVFTFERPVNLKQLIVHNGADAENFPKAHRARQLHLVFSTGHTADVTLLDSPDTQTLDIPGDTAGTVTLEVHVVSLYHAVQGTDLAVSELEFFEQRP